MMPDEHTPFRENIPAYAIGALDGEEVPALQTHLETCASCRTQLAEYRALSDSLLTAIPPKEPSAALRKSLQGRLPSAQKAAWRPRTFSLNLSRLALGFAVIALLTLNVISFAQLRQIQIQQASLVTQVENAQIVLGLMSSSTIQMIPISGEKASGTLLLDKGNNKAVLIVQNLPQLMENQTYQIWLVKSDGGRDTGGLFRPESGGTYTTKVILSPQSISDYVRIGVTVEPAGGSDAPTGERVFRVEF
jgi:anti-sigma-K factor RskA